MNRTGIYYRYSDYLGTNVQVGVAGDRVVSVKFTDSPDEDAEEDGVDVLDDVFDYLRGDDVDLSEHPTALTVGGVERDALERTRRIPYGTTVTYDELARSIGVDDVAGVKEGIDSNPVPVLLPSHRVVAESGLGDFAGPRDVKRKLLELESAI